MDITICRGCQNILPLWRTGKGNLYEVSTWYEQCWKQWLHHFEEEWLWSGTSSNQKIGWNFLRKITFIGGNVNPCLYMKKNKKGVVCMALYIDDNLLIGNPEAIKETVQLLWKNGLILKVGNNLSHSKWTIYNAESKMAYLRHLVQDASTFSYSLSTTCSLIYQKVFLTVHLKYKSCTVMYCWLNSFSMPC